MKVMSVFVVQKKKQLKYQVGNVFLSNDNVDKFDTSLSDF